MIPAKLSNRLIFVFSLAGLLVSSFLLYEYSLSGPIACLSGAGCDIVRASPYSSFLGISIPTLGVAFYLVMAFLSVVHPQKSFSGLILKSKIFLSLAGFAFGVYLTLLEIFVIKAICFWCVISFIISFAALLSVFLGRKKTNDKGN